MTQLWGKPTDGSSVESSKNTAVLEDSSDDNSVEIVTEKNSVASTNSCKKWTPHNSKVNTVVEGVPRQYGGASLPPGWAVYQNTADPDSQFFLIKKIIVLWILRPRS